MKRIWETFDNYGAYTDNTTPIIKSAHADLGGVDAGKDGVEADTETRPKNMKLVFIIRIE